MMSPAASGAGGGFLGYHLFSPSVRLPEFEGKDPTPEELVGGRHDGEVVVPGFTLNRSKSEKPSIRCRPSTGTPPG